MNFYPFHIGDYASATRHLTWDEDLAYRRLLDVYYTTERPLPSDESTVCRLILANTPDHRQAVTSVLNEFFQLTESGWESARCYAEIERMQDKRHKAQSSARASVNARRANAQRTLSERSANVELPIPIPDNKYKRKVSEVVKPDGVADSVWFDFLSIRKAKKSPITQTALAGIGREAAKAGVPLGEALSMCCERGWLGFKADWMPSKARDKGLETDYQRAMRIRMEEACPEIARRDPSLPSENHVEFFRTVDAQVVEIELLEGKE